MQDPRLRLLSVVVLSIAAFLSIPGAALAFVWWLLFSGGPGLLKRSGWPLIAFVPLVLVTISLWITGMEWLSYLIRLGVVLLIAIYAYQDQKSGDFISVAAWALGPVKGFDIGLAGELGFGSLRFLEDEVRRMRRAVLLKGIPFGIKSILTISAGLVFALIRRTDEQADLLVTRGYTRGGMACARFTSSPMDLISSGIAISVFILCFLPFREFFILIQ